MDWQISPYMPALALAGVIALLTATLSWRWRAAKGAAEIAILALFSGLWSWLYALELSSATYTNALLWAKVEYLFITGVPTMLLIFAARYTGRDTWIAGRRVLFLLLMPALTLIAVWTNDAHHLYWQTISWASSDAVSILKFSYGPLFWVFIIYSYACVSGATALLFLSILRSPSIFRGSTAALLIAIAAIWGGNALYISGLSPWGYLDLTPVSSTISGLAITLGIVRLRLFDLLPIARGTVLDQMGDGVVVIDEQDRVVDLNPAALQDLGCERNLALGAPTSLLFARWPHLVDRYRQTIRLSTELEIVTDDGRRWLDLSIAPIFDRRGLLRGRVIVWHDVTERKETEAALRDARDAAEAASRAKGAFLANMSHELRTPLSAIMGYCQLLRLGIEQGDIEQAHQDLTTIELAGDHLLQLIANLLHLSQLEAGALQINLEQVDVAAMMRDVVVNARQIVALKSNTLIVDISGSLGEMRTDEAKLRQVLINLLDNAAKFTQGGTITLIAGRELLDGREWLLFRVIDTGVGIDEDELGQLFTVFAEPDLEKRRKFGGTGVGLAISRYICQSMGGDVSASSAPGRGTAVTVRLPADGLAAQGAPRAEDSLAR